MLFLGSVLLAIASLTVADPSAGCDSSTTKPVEWDPRPGELKLFRVNDRNVRVTVPAKYNASEPAPIIIAFHDQDSSPEVLDYETAFGEEAVNEDAIVVYPTADNGRWSSELRPMKTIGPKSANHTEDILFTNLLLNDLETLLCLDTSRIYAAGLGSGGGMMHLLACDAELSKSFAAFAAVGGGFGRAKKGVKPWGVCETGRKTVPVMEIHGTDDGIFGYYLKEGENGKLRQIPPHWIEDWSERNGCGEPQGDAVQSKSDPTTFVTKLESGVMTETVQYGGSAIRIARQCFPDGLHPEKDDLPTGPLKAADASVLHYQVKRYGHGWPRQQLRKETEILFKDTIITPKSKSQYFDTSKIILNFFKSHTLPAQYAKRDQDAPPEPEQNMPSAEEFEKQLREMNANRAGTPKWSESQIVEKVQQFKEAQTTLTKADGFKGEIVSEERIRDEL